MSKLLHPLPLSLSPVEMARGLAHLPGLVFFDSAGNLPHDARRPLSILCARPQGTFTGHISDPSALDQFLTQNQAPEPLPGEPPFPAGGLCGKVDYEGSYHFAHYPEMLVYDHATRQWWELGSLSSEYTSTVSPPALPPLGPWRCSLPEEAFLSAVRTIQDYIRAGDIYQVNLSRRFQAAFTTPLSPSSLFPLYEVLRDASPAPMAAYLDLGDQEILSSSPETFLNLTGDRIETRPIKGTKPRFLQNPVADAASAASLTASEKERAELVMITDLLRNDIGQVCRFGSVYVEDMLHLESLQHVHHLVSTVRGRLRPGIRHLHALSACLPGGSITGAPKKRACEIIRELEPVPRGFYTGVTGYLGFNRVSQFQITIRSLSRRARHLSYHTGAGIVADSVAADEFQETEQKAAGIRLALARWLKP